MNTKQQQNQLRESFVRTNGIIMLEGWKPDAAALQRQERIISGEITHRQAIDEIVREAKEEARNMKARNESLQR